MPSVGPQGKVMDGRHSREQDRAVQMRKQRAAARGFPTEFVSKFCAIDFDQHQAGLAGAMPGRAFDDLAGSRKMQKTVGSIRFGRTV